MSLAASWLPPIRLENAPLNAWKSARSPRQCSGPVPASPRSVCVVIGPFIGWNCVIPSENGNGCEGAFSITPPRSPRSQARPSVSPSTWHDAHDIVPLPDSLAS